MPQRAIALPARTVTLPFGAARSSLLRRKLLIALQLLGISVACIGFAGAALAFSFGLGPSSSVAAPVALPVPETPDALPAR
jgi:hypothetical protein